MRFSLILLLLCTVCLCDAWLFGKKKPKTAASLIKVARKYVGSTAYSKKGCKHGRKFCGKWKCNLYVHDMLSKAKFKVPSRHWGYSPIGANEWGNPHSSYVKKTKCYINVSRPKPGDVVAFPVRSGNGHVGIVTYYGKYISAGEFKVEDKGIPGNRKKVYWRYQYNKRGCK